VGVYLRIEYKAKTCRFFELLVNDLKGQGKQLPELWNMVMKSRGKTLSERLEIGADSASEQKVR
jgi:hypothetical protein